MNKTTAGILFFIFHITIANGSVITYDPPPCPTCDTSLDRYIENNVLFTGTFSHYSMNLPGNPVNGSSGAIHLPFFSSMAILQIGGGIFSLHSVDLGEYNDMQTGRPQTILFTGHKADSSTVSQRFTIDGLMDGPGGIADFESFTFSSDFTNLTRVDISNATFSMDNLNISSVPIPASVWLFLSGILALIGISKHRP